MRLWYILTAIHPHNMERIHDRTVPLPESVWRHLQARWVQLLSRERWSFRTSSESILCFHSRGLHLCKFIGTKESVYIGKEFNSHRTGLGHKYGRHDVMRKHTILCVQYSCEWSWSVLNLDVARKGRPQSDCSFNWAFLTSINHSFVYLLTDDFVCRFGGGPSTTTLSMCAHCKV